MKERITALVFDNDRSHDYRLYTKNIVEKTEHEIDTIVRRTTKTLYYDLDENRSVDCIITVGENDFSILNDASFEIRKKWVHFDEYDKNAIIGAIINTFTFNINRDNGDDKIFSIFTCTFNTEENVLQRLYASLLNQTYKNWNWWILDDSTNDDVLQYIRKFKDPRITVFKNVSHHGIIGFNKHMAAMSCDGDYLVEVDHDDEITPDCLELIKGAFEKFPDTDFVYSHAFEEIDGEPVYYGNEFALGQGYYKNKIINGVEKTIAMTPDVNCLTLRHIVGLPNHVRCWKKEFYHKIGGHNIEMSVLDDMDILIRTFLYGKMCKVNDVLYIQHEGSSADNNGRGSTTQGKRFEEILRIGVLLRWKYDRDIHERIVELGYADEIWDEKNGYSIPQITNRHFPIFNYIYEPK